MKMHLTIDVRQCVCGDSFCGDCRTTSESTACGSWPKKPGYLTRDVSKVTCTKCKAFAEAQKPKELPGLRRDAQVLSPELHTEVGDLLTMLVDEAFEVPVPIHPSDAVSIEQGNTFVISRSMMNRVIETRNKVLKR